MTADSTALVAPLLSVSQLAQRLSEPAPPLLLDVRWALTGSQRPQYVEGHIPGAVFCDLEQDLTDPDASPVEAGRHPLPDEHRARARFEALGVRDDRAIVVYDAGDGIGSARAWWVLTFYGHREVVVLDGGVHAWTVAGHSLQSGEGSSPGPGRFLASSGHLPQVDIDQAAHAAAHGRLLDVRALERFAGRNEPVDPVAGRIPGAINVPVAAVTGEDGRLLAPSALAEVFGADVAARGTGGEALVVSCGSGVTATRAILALRTLGVEAALFNGSYSQWCRDPTRTIARG